MGKKPRSSQAAMKTHEKKQPIDSLIKIRRPKVYITDSTNFKNLVQQLTGNRNSPVSSPPPPPVSAASPPPTGVPFLDIIDLDQEYQEINGLDLSFDSSCFSGTPLECSPDLRVPDSCNYVMENSLHMPSQKNNNIDFSSECLMDLESLLMGIDSIPIPYNYDGCYGMINHQQEVCVYDYDLSTLI